MWGGDAFTPIQIAFAQQTQHGYEFFKPLSIGKLYVYQGKQMLSLNQSLSFSLTSLSQKSLHVVQR